MALRLSSQRLFRSFLRSPQRVQLRAVSSAAPDANTGQGEAAILEEKTAAPEKTIVPGEEKVVPEKAAVPKKTAVPKKKAVPKGTTPPEAAGLWPTDNTDPLLDSHTARMVQGLEKYMVATYVRPLPVFIRGDGSYMWDIRRRRYIDFTAGIAVNALGHGNRKLVRIMKDQAFSLMHTSNLYHNLWTGALCKSLVEKTRESSAFHNASRAFICSSGTEANEAALKFARKVGKTLGGDSKTGFVSFHNSFHGRTMGSLSATPNPKYQEPFAPMVPGFKYGTFNQVEGLDELVTEETCGVIVEPIQGEGGVHVGTSEFLEALAKRCREVGAVLIYDEIQCGLGRTGDLWAHKFLPKEAHPDILTTAKALGNGFPVAATIVNDFVGDKIVTGDHGTTFGGNPLASRIGHFVFGQLSRHVILKGVEEKGKVFQDRLWALVKKYPEVVQEVRGKGLILGLQLTRDPANLVKICREKGLLVITAGTNTVRFVPPLLIRDEVIQEGLKIFDEAMEEFVKEEVVKEG